MLRAILTLMLALVAGASAHAADLTAPLPQLKATLEAAPGVVAVEVVPATAQPVKLRIVHLLDYHYVPPDAFAADLRSQQSLSDADVERLYREHFDAVEAVQADQLKLLVYLVKHCGLQRVYQEGLTDRDMPAYLAMVDVLRKQRPAMEDLKQERDALAATAQPDDDMRRLLADIDDALKQYRRELLRLGAVGRLLIEGHKLEVVPLEDEAAYAAADPLQTNGTVAIDEEAMEARRGNQVRRMMQGGPVVFVVLGGGHDLRQATQANGGAIEHVRATPKAWKQYDGEAEW